MDISMDHDIQESVLPKYQQAKEAIKARIGEGMWKPGARILSERDLADSLQVSRITVKRAVLDLVEEGLLEHVAGRKGTFVRAHVAASSTRLIGVAIDDVRDTFGSSLLRGIEDYLWNRKFHLLLCNGDRNHAKIEEYFLSLMEQSIAGVLFCPVIDSGYAKNNARLISLLQKSKVPFVLMDRFVPGMLANYVGANHRESSREITRQLIRMGHRKILIGVGLKCTSMDERLQGYLDALRDAGIPANDRLIVRVNDNLLHGAPDPREMEVMADRVKAAGTFSCFYALNSRLLTAGIDVLRAGGWRIGTEVTVVSHDSDDRDLLPHPEGLPMVVQPTYEMGREAARILIDHITTPDAAIVQMVLKSRLVEAAAAGA
jgi:DNA-binding LacI/PurR family transcriptional regulator